MASRALIARLRIASSSWLASMRAGGSPSGMSSRSATRGPSERSSRSLMPWIRARRSTGTARRSCWRANASRRWVSDAPRSAPCSAPSISRCRRGSSGMRLRSRSRLPITAISRLLKSCATPPVSWPMVSIFCAWRNCSCAFSRAATSFIRSAVRCSTRCSSVAVNSASAVRSAASCASRFSRSISAILRAVISEETPTSDLMLPSGRAHRAGADVDPVLRAVGPDGAVFDAVVPAGLDGLLQHPGAPRAIVGMNRRQQILVRKRLAGPASEKRLAGVGGFKSRTPADAVPAHRDGRRSARSAAGPRSR